MVIKAYEKNNSNIFLIEDPNEQVKYGVLFVNEKFIKSGSFVEPDESYEEVYLEDFNGNSKKMVDNSKRYFEAYRELSQG